MVVANERGAYRATKYLIESRQQHIAVITGPALLANRLNGFRKPLREAHLSLVPKFIQVAELNTHSGLRVAKCVLRMLP